MENLLMIQIECGSFGLRNKHYQVIMKSQHYEIKKVKERKNYDHIMVVTAVEKNDFQIENFVQKSELGLAWVLRILFGDVFVSLKLVKPEW